MNNIDQIISLAIVLHRLPILNEIMIALSFLGEWGMIWIFLAAIFLIKDKKNGKIIFITLVLAIIIETILNDGILKQLLYRPRPFLALSEIKGLGILTTSSSFVSGHTATAFAQIIVIYFLAKKYFPHFLILGILIAFSRLYLGMHYLSDILGGIILGLFSGYFTLKLVNYWRNNKK